MAETKELIKKLNKALEWEYAATIQYVQHAATITGAQYTAIAQELITHANEELAHAVTVSKMIVDLGGTATVDLEKRAVSDDEKKMLEQDLEGEEIAIALYKDIIETAKKCSEFGKIYVLEGILAQEEEHRRDLIGALGR